MPRRFVPLALAALALSVSACGSDGSGSDEPDPPSAQEQVRAVALKLLASEDPQVGCRLMTRRYVAETYGTLARCLADDGDDALRGGRVEQVVVRGARATAQVEVPPADGLSRIAGTLELAREGGAWRVDRGSTDFLRSLLVAGAGKPGDRGLSTSAPVRRCMQKQFAALSDGGVRRFTLLASSRDRRLQPATLRLVERCQAAVADYVAVELVSALRREGRPAAFLRCMRREVRTYLTVTGLATRALRGNASDAGTAAIGGVALGAQSICRRATR
ncbi:MAG TPA: hypothetical protein VLK58_03310 [Conexibacter sp.]|nr:hypothetical protein [Conexibacter sp.]